MYLFLQLELPIYTDMLMYSLEKMMLVLKENSVKEHVSIVEGTNLGPAMSDYQWMQEALKIHGSTTIKFENQNVIKTA